MLPLCYYDVIPTKYTLHTMLLMFLIIVSLLSQCSLFSRYNNTLTFLSDNLVSCKDVFESDAMQAGSHSPTWPGQNDFKTKSRARALP